MAEALLLVLWVGTSLFFIFREIQEKGNRKSHEGWLSDVRESIHNIEFEFRRECEFALDSERNFMGKIIINKYRQKIYELKDEYKNSLYEKIVARMGKYCVKSIPEFLEREYERNISDIADTFLCFCNVLSNQQ